MAGGRRPQTALRATGTENSSGRLGNLPGCDPRTQHQEQPAGSGAQEHVQQKEPWEAAGGRQTGAARRPAALPSGRTDVSLHTHARKPAHVCARGQAPGGPPGTILAVC